MRSLAALLLLASLLACVAALPVQSDFVSSQIAILNSSSSPACLGRCPWCDLLKEYIPSFCVIEDDVCLNVMCNLEIANMTFGFHYNLGVCHDPVSVAFSVDYSPQKFHADMGPYTASAHVGVPGLTVGAAPCAPAPFCKLAAPRHLYNTHRLQAFHIFSKPACLCS